MERALSEELFDTSLKIHSWMDLPVRLSVNGSSTRGGDTSQEFRTVLNMPISETAGLRFVGQYINSGGWIEQPALNKEDINDYELLNFRTKFLWQPSDEVELKATAIVHRNDAGAQNYTNDKGYYQQALDDPSTPSAEENYELFSLSLQYDLGDIRLVSATSYLDSDMQILNFGDQCCFSTGTATDLEHTLYRDWKDSSEVLSQEFRISSNNSGPWNWTSGLFYKDATFVPLDINQFFFGTFGGVVFFAGDTFYTRRESKSWAVFGETSYKLTDQLEIGAGLRYFEDDRKFYGSRTSAPLQDSFESANPKLYLSYHLSEDVHLYASAAKGFRSGGFNFFSTDPVYRPESVWSYELGSKISSMDGRLNTELAVYHTKYDDRLMSVIDPAIGFGVTVNVGNVDIQGVDLSLRYFATEHLELGFTGNYVDSEFKEINAAASSHAVGDPLDLVPQYNYSLWVNYSFSWADKSPGFLRIDYSEQGESHFRNRTFDNPSVGLVYHYTSGIVEMLNARLGWEKDSWSVELYTLNLLDEDDSSTPFERQWAASRPRPRTMGINVGYQF